MLPMDGPSRSYLYLVSIAEQACVTACKDPCCRIESNARDTHVDCYASRFDDPIDPPHGIAVSTNWASTKTAGDIILL